MNTHENQNSVIVGCLIFFLCQAPLIAMAFGFSIAPFKATLWKLTTRFHVPVNATITECQVFEKESHAGSNKRYTGPGFSQYFPEIKIEFEFNKRKYSSTIPLTRMGYSSPDSAFSHLQKLAPNQKIEYIHTYLKNIDFRDSAFFKQLRITENSDQKNFITLMINPHNPNDNESLYTKFSWWDWGLVLLFAITPAFIIPIFLFRFTDITFNSRINYCIILLILSALLYTTVDMYITNSRKKEMNDPSSIYYHGYFHLMIDHTYDGSQAEQYIQVK